MKSVCGAGKGGNDRYINKVCLKIADKMRRLARIPQRIADGAISSFRNTFRTEGDELKKAYAYCKDLTNKCGPNFALGFYFLPKEKRMAVYAVYSFSRYVDDIVDELKDKANMQTMLDKWEHYLDRAYEGKGDHPITIALADSVKRYNIPKQPFRDLIKGCKMDLTIKRYRTFDDLLEYCDKVASTISILSLSIFGYTDKKAQRFGKDLSTALQLTNIIRDVGEDVDRGRIYIPLEDMERFNYTEEDLLAKKNNANFKRLMKFQIERARHYYQSAFNLLPFIKADSRFATLLMGAVYVKILDEIEANDYDVFTKRAKLSKFKKVVLVAEMALRPKFVVSKLATPAV